MKNLCRSRSGVIRQRIFGSEGFTILEIITVCLLLGIIGATSLHGLGSGIEGFITARERKAIYDDGILAIERMVREIRSASQIITPTQGNSGSSLNFTKESYESFTIPTSDNSTDITFRKNGTSLEREGDLSGIAVLADNLSNFQATHESGNYITLELTLNSTNGGTLSMRTKVFARNVP
jgi:type II secretory pathway pseudopilin PulG